MFPNVGLFILLCVRIEIIRAGREMLLSISLFVGHKWINHSRIAFVIYTL